MATATTEAEPQAVQMSDDDAKSVEREIERLGRELAPYTAAGLGATSWAEELRARRAALRQSLEAHRKRRQDAESARFREERERKAEAERLAKAEAEADKRALTWLESTLAAAGRGVAKDDVLRDAKAAGIDLRALGTAVQELEVAEVAGSDLLGRASGERRTFWTRSAWMIPTRPATVG
jgi:hypothetical protein